MASANPSLQVLVADHEASVRESCVGILRQAGYQVTQCGRCDDALDLLKRRAFDLVLAEEVCPGGWDGQTALQAALATNPDTVVIIMTDHATVESSVEAMRLGAWYYLPKPFTATQLQLLVARAAHLKGATGDERRTGTASSPPGAPAIGLVGRAPAFRLVVDLARRVAASDVPVLLTGESGSGKELLAQFIHHHSARAARPVVALNCAALPEGLLESEMFGHRKGAFTGAVREKAGLLEAAHGGTMFLDEVLEMSKPIQAKLLRVIEDGVVRRVGSETTDAVVDVRFIAAANRDLEAAVRAGVLREDLYYRLNVVRIHVPPLRERPDDIPLLANLFVATYWRRNHPKGAPVPRLSDRAIRALCGHPWRGNVRELQNVIECATVLAAPGQELEPWDLRLPEETFSTMRMAAAPDAESLDDTLDTARSRFLAQFEVEYLRWLVNKAEGNMSMAARLAGVDRTTLYRMQRRLGLQRNPTPIWIERPPREDSRKAQRSRKPQPSGEAA